MAAAAQAGRCHEDCCKPSRVDLPTSSPLENASTRLGCSPGLALSSCFSFGGQEGTWRGKGVNPFQCFVCVVKMRRCCSPGMASMLFVALPCSLFLFSLCFCLFWGGGEVSGSLLMPCLCSEDLSWLLSQIWLPALSFEDSLSCFETFFFHRPVLAIEATKMRESRFSGEWGGAAIYLFG